MKSCFRVGGLFACLGFYEILLSCRSISIAPVRGGTHFLCCCKESKQRKQLPIRPRSHAIWVVLSSIVGCLKSALIGPIGLGSRTVCHIAPHNKLVQHQIAPARFAADRSIGSARASLLTSSSRCTCLTSVSLAYPAAARSAVPKQFRAEPVSLEN